MKTLNFPMEKVFVNLDRYGNLSAASAMVALCEAVEQGRLKAGDLVTLVAFGAGLSWGATVLRWQPPQ
jgi:3-oxoacyl-[acyl-carrier-protein] synthase-3